MNKRYIHLILIVLLFSLLMGCRAEKEDIQEIEEDDQNVIVEDPTPDFGGEIKIAIRNPETLNPILNSDRTIDQMLKLVFDPLFELNDEQKPIPNLVEHYVISTDGLYIDVTLKEDLLWHDGEPMNSDDIIFTVGQLQNANTSVVYKKTVANIARITKIDDLTVRFYYNQASAVNLYSLVFPIIPRHYYEGNMRLTAGVNLEPIGSGMYQFENFTPMKQISLIRNDDWWKGKAYIDKVTAVVIGDPETDSASFDQNVIQVLSPSIFNWKNFAENDTLRIISYTSYYYDFLGFNFNNTILSDLNVRKSIALSINRESLIKEHYLNHAVITDTPIHPESWLANDLEIKYSFNQEDAKQYLKNAGWVEKNENNVLVKDNVSLKLRLLINNQDSIKTQVAETIIAQLESIGFEIELQSVDYPTFNSLLSAGDYDIVLGAWKLSPMPDLSFAFHSSAIASGTNFIRYNDPVMDSLLSQAYSAYTEDAILNSYSELLTYTQEQLPYFSLYFKNSAVILDRSIFGDLTPDTYNIFEGFENLYMAK